MKFFPPDYILKASALRKVYPIVNAIVFFTMTRGNQRDIDRQRAANRREKAVGKEAKSGDPKVSISGVRFYTCPKQGNK